MGKTFAAVRALKWLKTAPGPAKGADGAGFYQQSDASWGYEQWHVNESGPDTCTGNWIVMSPPETYPRLPPDSGPNYVSVGQFGMGTTSCVSTLKMNFSSGGIFGAPIPLAMLPDGTQILSALAEVSCNGLTRTKTTYYSDGTPTAHSTDITGLGYTIIGWVTPQDYEEIGSVSAAPGITVVPFTDIINVMFSERATSKYAYGYSCLVTPPEGTLLAEGPRRPMDDPPDNPPGSCPAPTEEYYMDVSDTISWDSLGIGTILLEIQYPEEERNRKIIQPQWPPMG